jgi:hypothetical protein
MDAVIMIVTPAKGHPTKYHFVGTPKAGASWRRAVTSGPEIPAFAGKTKGIE